MGGWVGGYVVGNGIGRYVTHVCEWKESVLSV